MNPTEDPTSPNPSRQDPQAAPDALDLPDVIQPSPDSSVHHQSRRWRLGFNGLLLAALLILTTLMVPWFQHFTGCLTYPFQVDAEEGFIFHQAVSLAQGESIYRPIDTPPFLVANYPPLYPWIYSLVNGDRIDHRSLPRGRAIVGVFTFGAALGMALILLITTGRWLPALLAPMLFLVTYEVNQWVGYARVDLPSIFFTVAGLAIFLVSTRRWALVISALLFVCAAWCRQTALAAPAACLLVLLLRDRRALAWFAVPYAVIGLSIFFWINAATEGQLYLHLVTYNRNVMDWHGWRLVMKNEVWFFYHWLIAAMILGTIFITWSNFRRRKQRSPETPSASPLRRIHPRSDAAQVLGFYALLAIPTIVTYAKIGAAPNYVLEPLTGTILWTLYALGILMNNCINRPCNAEPQVKFSTHHLAFQHAGPPLALAVLILIHSIYILHVSGAVFSTATPTAGDVERAHKVVVSLRQSPGDVLCEDPVLTMLAGKRVLFQPFIMSRLAREGRWDERLINDMILARQFGLIVVTADLSQGDANTNYQRFTASMGQSLRKAYRPLGVIPLPDLRINYFAWTPHQN